MGNDVPTFEMQRAGASRRLTIRGRFVLGFGVLAAVCVAMAFATGTAEPGGWYGGQYSAAHLAPNLAWLYLAFWPGAVAVVMGFGGWLLTGRL